ncbi:MAG: hypothetical protein JNL66_15060 [Alphaproteobacteria bacterium]|nr:hypothetical protein [Alphaproteobacteria bacterium]
MAGGIGGFFRNLFGGGTGTPAAESVEAATEYKGYQIRPAPQKQANGWLTSGVISKQFPDGVKEHRFIRADTYPSRDDSLAFCVSKGRQIIDEQGDRIFAERTPPASS